MIDHKKGANEIQSLLEGNEKELEEYIKSIERVSDLHAPKELKQLTLSKVHVMQQRKEFLCNEKNPKRRLFDYGVKVGIGVAASLGMLVSINFITLNQEFVVERTRYLTDDHYEPLDETVDKLKLITDYILEQIGGN